MAGLYSFIKEQFYNNNFAATIADIRLRASYPNNKIVIVEGTSDSIVFINKFDSKIHILQPFCKGNAEKIMEQIGTNYKNVIAILDRDYEPLSNDPRVFYYDYCNLEMMIISHDDIFLNFASDLSNKQLLEKRDEILKHLKPLSCLRVLNSMSSTTNCKQFSAKKAIGSLDCMQYNNETVISYIKSNIVCNLSSSNLSSNDKNEILNAFNDNINSLICLNVYDITNGHDFNELFILFLSNYINVDESTGIDSIYHIYERTFDESIFKTTKIYKNIKNYSERNNLKFLNI